MLVQDGEAHPGMVRVRLPPSSNCSSCAEPHAAPAAVAAANDSRCAFKLKVRPGRADDFPLVQDSGLTLRKAATAMRLPRLCIRCDNSFHFLCVPDIQKLSISFARSSEYARGSAISGAFSNFTRRHQRGSTCMSYRNGMQPRCYRRRTALLRHPLACRSMFSPNGADIPRTLSIWLACPFDSY